MSIATQVERSFVPGLGREWLLPLYDPLTAIIGIDRARRVLVEHAALGPSDRVLDVGCGTGTLAVLIKRLHPEVDVTGLDPDAKALTRGSLKAKRAGVPIRFDRGFGDALPYAEGSFDHVFSSFMFHHLEHAEKQATLREVHRVLKPEGRLLLVDFAGPDAAARGTLARALHGQHRLADNGAADVLALMGQAALAGARKVGHRTLFAGLMHVAYYAASRPATESLADYQV